MKVNDKEYQPIKPEDISVRQAKVLDLTAKAYTAYIGAEVQQEAARYDTLKALWSELIALGVFVETDEVIKSFDNIGIEDMSTFINDFFHESSEAKK